MGSLEDRIYEAMVALRESEPDCDRHMFVLPTNLMAVPGASHVPGTRVVRMDAVAMICRD